MVSIPVAVSRTGSAARSRRLGPVTLVIGGAAAVCLAGAWLAPAGAPVDDSPALHTVAATAPLAAQAPGDSGDSGSDDFSSTADGSEGLTPRGAGGGSGGGSGSSGGSAVSGGGEAPPSAGESGGGQSVTGADGLTEDELPDATAPPLVRPQAGSSGEAAAVESAGGSAGASDDGDSGGGGVGDLVDDVLSGVFALLDKLIP